MEYIIDQITEKLYTSRAFRLYFGEMKLAAADIETTGLNPKTSRFVLGGLLSVSCASQGCGILKVEQFFAETLSEEQKALTAYVSALREMDVLLTYNGRRFDLPFIRARAGGGAEDLPFNLDLYLLVKKYSPVRKFLPNLKQKSVENFLGLWSGRQDEISGAESVDLYYRYLAEKDSAVKEKILLHNHDDVVQLYRLLSILEKVDLHQAMYDYGFPIRPPAGNLPGLIIEKIRMSEDQLVFSGKQIGKPLAWRGFEWAGMPCFLCFERGNRSFQVSIPLIRQSGLVLLDLKALGMFLPVFQKYPSCQEGFLILQERKTIHYLETNHFIKIFLERMLYQWITKKEPPK